MNIYGKLQKCRCELQKRKLKKSGKNKFAGFEYFELQDFLPTINELFLENGLSSNFSILNDIATLEIIDFEAKDGEANSTSFTTKVEDLELKGCNKVQALGGAMTYLKRYLYLNALEIVENDMFDGITQLETTTKKETTPIDKIYQKRLKDCATLEELRTTFTEVYPETVDKKALTALKDEIKAKLEEK